MISKIYHNCLTVTGRANLLDKPPNVTACHGIWALPEDGAQVMGVVDPVRDYNDEVEQDLHVD